MLSRLRNALYWLACGLAVALFFVSLYVFLTDTTALGIAMAITIALTGVVVWLLGWAFRYALSGT
jgi:CBS-domain-containing membrane protein